MSVLKTPAECTAQVCTIGANKSKLGIGKTLYLAFLAGAFIGFGSLLAIKIGGFMPVEYWGNIQRLVFAGVFPVGLLLVLVAGADLFTGNCMYLPSAISSGKCDFGGLVKSWVFSYAGNFVGSVAVAFVLGLCTGILFDKIGDGSMPLATYAINLANAKCNLPWDVAFIRGIGCNWLVCLAIFMALTATDGVSKVALIWPPITAFVALGFEHSVANMTFVPLGIFLGESQAYLASANPVALTANWSDFFINNLIPVTLGNIVGGALLTLMVSAYPVPKDPK